MNRRKDAPDQESISLQSLKIRHNSSGDDVEASNTSSDEAHSHADPRWPHLRQQPVRATCRSGDTVTSSINLHAVYHRFLAFIMSRNPLLIRSSPALGTGSYGAVPVIHSPESSVSSETSEDERDDVRRRDKRKTIHTSRTGNQIQASASTPNVVPQHTSKSRARDRTSSHASELGMGIESKASYAGTGPLPHRLLDDLRVHSNSGSAASSTERSSKSSRRRRDAANDPMDNSPYPQVRASVPATDDITLSISTPRMWTLSLLFAFAGSATNLFFSLRYPSVAITPVIALVLVHPLGKFWDLLLKRPDDPEDTFADGIHQSREAETKSVSHRFRLWLAQGRWNEKEHACVYISSNVSFGFAFATDVIVEQHKFYKQDVPILYQILLTISTQILGYAFAGLTRRYLVRPAAMIWPGTLMSTAMFTTMHKKDNEPANGWTTSRYRFFVYVWIGAFAWYFLPGFLFPALSYFNVLTWFAPNNVVVANLVS